MHVTMAEVSDLRPQGLFIKPQYLSMLRLQELAVDSVRCVMRVIDNDKREVEVKKYAKIEKIPGGAIEDCRVLDGVMFSKDVVNPSRMKRIVRNPRILLLDCPVEYKKGENQTNVELLNETDFAELLRQEEEVNFFSVT